MADFQITTEGRTWLELLVDKGLFVVDGTSASFDPRVQILVSAIHEVLAGGTVEVTITQPGSVALKKTLDDLLEETLESTNKLGDAAGHVVYP